MRLASPNKEGRLDGAWSGIMRVTVNGAGLLRGRSDPKNLNLKSHRKSRGQREKDETFHRSKKKVNSNQIGILKILSGF